MSQGRQFQSLLRTAAAVIIVGSCGDASASTGPASCSPSCQYSDCYSPTPYFDISSPRFAIGIGDTTRLGITDNSTVTWLAVTPSLATISSSGLVTGVASGTARFQATRSTGTPLIAELTIEVFTSICRSADATSAIAVGDSVTGVLDSTSCGIEAPPGLLHWPTEPTGPDFEPTARVARGWRITVPDSQSVRFELRTSGYPPVLYVTDSLMTPLIGRDNRSGIATTAVPYLLPGSYTVWASSFDVRATGSFALAAHSAATCAPEAHTADTIRAQQSMLDALTPTGCYLREGQPADVWRLHLATAERLRITLTGTALNSGMAVVYSQPEGSFNFFLDGIELPAGHHALVVFGEHFGAYQLNVLRCLQPVGQTCMP